MAVNNRQFPSTLEGIQRAFASDPDGWWEEKVDWWSEKDYVFGAVDEKLVLFALKQTVIEQPDLFTLVEIARINQALEAFNC